MLFALVKQFDRFIISLQLKVMAYRYLSLPTLECDRDLFYNKRLAFLLSVKTKVIVSNLLLINITQWYHPNSLKPLTGGFHTSQEKYAVGEWFICRLYKVRGSTKHHIPIFIKSKDFTQCENTRIVFFKRNTCWGMSCGQPCNH